MAVIKEIKRLRSTLIQIGVIFVFGLYPLAIIWPSGWAWHTGQSEYLQMILAIYATLGVFLIFASRDPLSHRSLIWFTVWSSIVHGTVMAVQTVVNPEHIGHLFGDVPALFLVAGVLTFRMRRAESSAIQSSS
jgi:FtsH-binding integral membrane protein